MFENTLREILILKKTKKLNVIIVVLYIYVLGEVQPI